MITGMHVWHKYWSRKTLGGRTSKHRCFKKGDTFEVEFLGEDSDLNFIDFRLEDGLCAIHVPRFAVAVSRCLE